MMQEIKEEEKMTPEQFTYWLQGFMEMAEPEKLSKKQLSMIKDHLALVFKKKTPDYNITVSESTEQISVPPLGHQPYVSPLEFTKGHGAYCDCSICALSSTKPLILTC